MTEVQKAVLAERVRIITLLQDAAAHHHRERERIIQQGGPLWLAADHQARGEECAKRAERIREG